MSNNTEYEWCGLNESDGLQDGKEDGSNSNVHPLYSHVMGRDAVLYSASYGAAGDLFPCRRGRGLAEAAPHSFVSLNNDSLTLRHLIVPLSPRFLPVSNLKRRTPIHPVSGKERCSFPLPFPPYRNTVALETQ